MTICCNIWSNELPAPFSWRAMNCHPNGFQAWKTDQDTWPECGESAHVSGTFLLALTAFTIWIHWVCRLRNERCGWFFSDVIHSHTLSAWPRSTRFVCLYNSLFSSDVRSMFVCFDTWSFDFWNARHTVPRAPFAYLYQESNAAKVQLEFQISVSRRCPEGIGESECMMIIWCGSQTDAVLEGITRHGLICFKLCCYTWTWSAMWIPEGGLKSFVVFHVPFNSKYLQDL